MKRITKSTAEPLLLTSNGHNYKVIISSLTHKNYSNNNKIAPPALTDAMLLICVFIHSKENNAKH